MNTIKLKKNHRVIDIETRQIGKVLYTTRDAVIVAFQKTGDGWYGDTLDVRYSKSAGRLTRWYLRPRKYKAPPAVAAGHPELPLKTEVAVATKRSRHSL